MKNIIKSLTIILVITSFSLETFSQFDTVRTNLISFVPQYVINKALRVDYEKNIQNNHWLLLAPQFYVNENTGNENYSDLHNGNYKRLTGFGLDVYHKIYANKNHLPVEHILDTDSTINTN